MALFFKRFASLVLGLALTTQLAVAWSFSDLLSIFCCRKQKSQQTVPLTSVVSEPQSQSKDSAHIKEASKEAKTVEKQSSVDLSKSPLVIILNGTSSAGKSSITKQMLAMLGKNWEAISIDDYITDEFFRRYPQALLSNANVEGICLKIFQSSGVGNFLMNGNVLAAMADYVHHCCSEGKNIIVDVVLYEKNYTSFLNALRDCNVRHCIVYCPLPELVRRVSVRNERASCKDATILEKMERRDLARAVRRFGTLYTYGATHSIDRLTDTDREAVLSLVQKDYADSSLTSEGKQSFEQFYAEFEKNIGSNRAGYTIQPVLPYDFIVNSGLYNQYECACRIVDYIASQQDHVNNVALVC